MVKKDLHNVEMTEYVDWQTIRNALIFLGISAVISTSLIMGTFMFLDRIKGQHDVQEKYLDNIRTRYRRLDEEIATIDTYFPHFQRLVQLGLIGKEHRLTWLEALRNAAERIGFPELHYNISSREPHVPDFPIEDGPYRIYASEMQLTTGLLHEGDLFSLLEELDRHAVGIYHVVHCKLRRVGWGGSHAPNRANLHCECMLRWYTLEKRANNRS
uniref:Uncharacterized protein n=1 Tax=Candidatus Kentrum sp. FW TaxID=2126338 RepID=A0A450TZB0_9GAMM|nr:MAG: hypothetical protein BECKFW1821C_GA0114237_10716 [Candidatus Kentron sp. FW]